MSKSVKKIYHKNKVIILYAFFGIVTTLANFWAFVLCTHLFSEEMYILNNAVAWFAGVVTAFITNKLWVFNSKSWKLKIAGKEFLEFSAARLLSFAFEEFGLIFCVEVVGWGMGSFSLFGYNLSTQIIIKLVLSVGVVISNYVVSKYIIFKKNNSEKY